MIAIVDDEPAIRKAIARLLRSAGYEVAAYESASAFFAALQTQVPQCVVLDLNMPDVSGFVVLEALHHNGQKVPTIVLSADGTSISLDRAMKLGAKAYLVKPCDDEKLLDAVSAALQPSERAAVLRADRPNT